MPLDTIPDLRQSCGVQPYELCTQHRTFLDSSDQLPFGRLNACLKHCDVLQQSRWNLPRLGKTRRGLFRWRSKCHTWPERVDPAKSAASNVTAIATTRTTGCSLNGAAIALGRNLTIAPMIGLRGCIRLTSENNPLTRSETTIQHHHSENIRWSSRLAPRDGSKLPASRRRVMRERGLLCAWLHTGTRLPRPTGKAIAFSTGNKGSNSVVVPFPSCPSFLPFSTSVV